MKMPATAPTIKELLATLPGPEQVRALTAKVADRYWHWDDLRHRAAPDGLSREAWWLAMKWRRMSVAKEIPLRDVAGRPFRFGVPDMVMEQLHEIDLGAGSRIGLAGQVANAATRDQYLVRSLIHEAINSSQLEGALTTREVAKEMIRSGRGPRDRSERMILNNYLTMARIREIKDRELTPELVCELHRQLAEGTLDNPAAVGRLRRQEETVRVEDTMGEVFHFPPPADQLEARLAAMCAFANAADAKPFIHPAIRAIILHFWLAYDHPFVDGNGRTARALFYWAMLRADYWLFEFISISDSLKRAPNKYYRAFLHTETDENDLTYFIIHQAGVIREAIANLHAYIDRKTAEVSESEGLLRDRNYNHRQLALIGHSLRHPGAVYTVLGHQTSHHTVNETARKDLMQLAADGLLIKAKRGRQMVFHVPPDIEQRIRQTTANP